MRGTKKVFGCIAIIMFMATGISYSAPLEFDDGIFAVNGNNATDYWAVVGDAGNNPDSRYYPYCGAVAYEYAIGKYEVTNAQYAAFLNAVAGTSDPHSLYNSNMNITKTGSIYTPVANMENKPVVYVSWNDAARFVNWLNNGAKNDPLSTETGTYTMSLGGSLITRNEGAGYWLPSEDEWYKAAYYKGGSTNAGYWDFATQSDTLTTDDANYNNSVGSATDVGAYDIESYYGTYDQSGNVWEWNETKFSDWNRGLRGGSYGGYSEIYQSAFCRSHYSIGDQWLDIGFRIASSYPYYDDGGATVPEPASIGLVAISLIGFVYRRKARV